MLIPSSDGKYLLSVIYHWNKFRMVRCQVMKSVQWICTQMKLPGDSSERKNIHLSNGLIQNFEIRYTFRVWIHSGRCGFILKNITLDHCLVVLCNHVSAFFLYLKECVIISKFGPTVWCGLTRETRLTRHKPTALCTRLLDCMKCTTLDGDPLTQRSLSGAVWENSCLSITRVAGLLEKVYNGGIRTWIVLVCDFWAWWLSYQWILLDRCYKHRGGEPDRDCMCFYCV